MSVNEKPSDWCQRMYEEAEQRSDMDSAFNYFQLKEMWLKQGR